MKSHERLIENAKEAIDEVFSDTSVTQETTIESLMDLRNEIEMKIQAIRADLKQRT